MKLYYKPGACSLASHIALREIGGPFEIEKVDTGAQRTDDGQDFAAINPKGYVPVLRLDSGETLTEGAAILQYLADANPNAGLAPKPGTLERTRVQEHLNYVASELHKAFSPLFATPPLKGNARTAVEAKIARRMQYFEDFLSDGRDYLLGKAFSVADAYLFVVANWAKPTGVGLERWPHVAAFVDRVGQRKATQDALRAEGLIQ